MHSQNLVCPPESVFRTFGYNPTTSTANCLTVEEACLIGETTLEDVATEYDDEADVL